MSAAQDPWRQPFELDVVPDREFVRLSARGEIDLATVGAVRERTDELVASGFRRVVLDLREVTFLDSSGLHLILELVASSQSDGWELGVVEGPAAVQRAFQVAGMNGVVPYVDAAQIRNGRWT